jgi:Acetyltransferase (GNAT) domain
MIQLVPYMPDHASAWNEFVAKAKNGHFFFDRRYMDYHADRFRDASLVVVEDDAILALLPANVTDDVLITHQGLTFGGVITQSASMSTSKMMAIIEGILQHARARDLRRLVYKALPHIYHLQPAEEDLYALFRVGARIEHTDVTTTIDQHARGRISQRRLRGAKKAQKEGVVVSQSTDWPQFWKVLTARLEEKYATRPVHTVEEIAMLARRWPENIRLWVATRNSELLAGIVIYGTARVAHAQYISASAPGLELGALDLLFQSVIAHYEKRLRYFDFGISTEKAGTHLNEGLIAHKEGFGGSAIVHASYSLAL